MVGIDEGQFFPDLLPFCEAVSNAGKTVVVAALDGTFQRKVSAMHACVRMLVAPVRAQLCQGQGLPARRLLVDVVHRLVRACCWLTLPHVPCLDSKQSV